MADMSDMILQAASRAVQDGIASDGDYDTSPSGPIAQWVRTNVNYKRDQEFFVVFSIACEIANIHARGTST